MTQTYRTPAVMVAPAIAAPLTLKQEFELVLAKSKSDQQLKTNLVTERILKLLVADFRRYIISQLSQSDKDKTLFVWKPHTGYSAWQEFCYCFFQRTLPWNEEAKEKLIAFLQAEGLNVKMCSDYDYIIYRP